MGLGDCPRCWNNPCTCGHQASTLSIGGRVVNLVSRMEYEALVKRIKELETKVRELECRPNMRP